MVQSAMLFLSTGAPSVSLSISPASQSVTNTAANWVYSAATVTVTGGTATAWNWTCINPIGPGTWTVPTGATTATATPRKVSATVGEVHTCDFQADVTVGGVHYFATAPLSYTRT